MGGQRKCWLVSREMETQVKSRRGDFLPQTSMLRRFQERGGRERKEKKKKKKEYQHCDLLWWTSLSSFPSPTTQLLLSLWHNQRLVARKRRSTGNSYGFSTALDTANCSPSNDENRCYMIQAAKVPICCFKVPPPSPLPPSVPSFSDLMNLLTSLPRLPPALAHVSQAHFNLLIITSYSC